MNIINRLEEIEEFDIHRIEAAIKAASIACGYKFEEEHIKELALEVPVWDKVQETVCRAAQVVPDMRYIGWDVVITEDYKVALVEGNSGADPDAEQISSGKGRWPVYWNLIKDINAKLIRQKIEWID